MKWESGGMREESCRRHAQPLKRVMVRFHRWSTHFDGPFLLFSITPHVAQREQSLSFVFPASPRCDPPAVRLVLLWETSFVYWALNEGHARFLPPFIILRIYNLFSILFYCIFVIGILRFVCLIDIGRKNVVEGEAFE